MMGLICIAKAFIPFLNEGEAKKHTRYVFVSPTLDDLLADEMLSSTT